MTARSGNVKIERYQTRIGIEASGLDHVRFTSLVALAHGEGSGWARIGPDRDQRVDFITVREVGGSSTKGYDISLNVMRRRMASSGDKPYEAEISEFALVSLSEILGEEVIWAEPEQARR